MSEAAVEVDFPFPENAYLLDVRPAGVFARGHIPESHNNAVFETAFDSRLPETSEVTGPLIVIGQNACSAEASFAAEKLQRAGFADVRMYRAGVDAWTKAGQALESHPDVEPEPEMTPLSGTRAIDVEQSHLEWQGRNLLNRHYGTLQFSEGELMFEENQIVGGYVVVDWSSFECSDLKGTDLHDVLKAQLFSHDFFDIEAHPPCRFDIESVQPPAAAGTASLGIHGKLELRGQTHPLHVQATGGRTAEGGFAFQAPFTFDRTQWGAVYGSGSFFQNLGMHLVNDLIEMGVKVVTD